jgi:hypothetical protein
MRALNNDWHVVRSNLSDLEQGIGTEAIKKSSIADISPASIFSQVAQG